MKKKSKRLIIANFLHTIIKKGKLIMMKLKNYKHIIIKSLLIILLLALELCIEPKILRSGSALELFPFSIYKSLSSFGFIMISFILVVDKSIFSNKTVIKVKVLIVSIVFLIAAIIPQQYLLTNFASNIPFNLFIWLQSPYLNHGLCIIAGYLLGRSFVAKRRIGAF